MDQNLAKILADRISILLRQREPRVREEIARIKNDYEARGLFMSGMRFRGVANVLSADQTRLADEIWDAVYPILSESHVLYSEDLATELKALVDRFYPGRSQSIRERLVAEAASLRRGSVNVDLHLSRIVQAGDLGRCSLHNKIEAFCLSLRNQIPTLTISSEAEDKIDPAGVHAIRIGRLDPTAEQEFAKHNFKSHLPIVLTGEVEKGGGNVVQVAGEKVSLPPKQFCFFLRLVRELQRGKNGYVTSEKLIKERLALSKTNVNGVVFQLRKNFQHALEGQGIDKFDFIEAPKLMVRLSTHPQYISCSPIKSRPLEQYDPEIRKQVRGLRQAPISSPDILR